MRVQARQPAPKETMMRFYNQPHRFYAGIDLHARSLYLCVLDQDGSVLFHANLNAQPAALLAALAPFRDGLVVAAECMFAWYWLADLCAAEKIPFVLGHALYMKAIHGGKSKNDRIDAHTIATLLRGGMLPQAYVYPKGMRETRDLLRRRMFLVHKRAEAITHIQNTNSQYNLPAFGQKLAYAANRDELRVAERFADPSVRKSVEADLALIDHLDDSLADLELYLTRTAKVDDIHTYERLKTVPGVGPILALVLLYEIHDIRRFDTVGQFLSYARLVRPDKESAGKKLGFGNKKIGNAHLRWAFAEAVCLFLRGNEQAKRWQAKKVKTHGKGKTLAILAAKLGRAVYHLLRKEQPFDAARFWNNG
jgi:transposase